MGRADQKQTLTFYGINRYPETSTNNEELVAVKSIQPPHPHIHQSSSSRNEDSATATSTGFQYPKSTARARTVAASSSSARRRFRRLNLSDLTATNTSAAPSISTLSELFGQQTRLQEDHDDDDLGDSMVGIQEEESWSRFEYEDDIRPQLANLKLSKKERASIRGTANSNNNNRLTTTLSNGPSSRRDNYTRTKATNDKLGEVGIYLAQRAGLRDEYPDLDWSGRRLFVPSVARRYGYSFIALGARQGNNRRLTNTQEEALQRVNQTGLGGWRSGLADVMLGILVRRQIGLLRQGEVYLYEEGKKWDQKLETVRNEMRDVMMGLTDMSVG